MSSYNCREFTDWYSLAHDVYPFTVVFIVILCLSVLPTFVLNALILTAIVRTPNLHNPSNILTCNLTAANLVLALAAIPFAVAWKLLELYHHDNNVICTLTITSSIVSSNFIGCILMNLLFATVDRYLALVLHLRYRSIVTNARMIKLCAFTWITSPLQSTSILIGAYVYRIFVAALIVVSLTIIGFCYYKIFTIIRRHRSRIAGRAVNTTAVTHHTNMARYRGSVLNLLYVVGCQFIFFTPFLCSLVVFGIRGVSVASLQLLTVSISCMFLSSFFDPLLMCMKNGELRAAVKGTAIHCWAKIKEAKIAWPRGHGLGLGFQWFDSA